MKPRVSVLECASPSACAARQSAASARRRLALWNPSRIRKRQRAAALQNLAAPARPPWLDIRSTEAQRAIDLLQERRTALISATVIGQIDVRASVASALSSRVGSTSP